jgi:hypothetical protein
MSIVRIPHPSQHAASVALRACTMRLLVVSELQPFKCEPSVTFGGGIIHAVIANSLQFTLNLLKNPPFLSQPQRGCQAALSK